MRNILHKSCGESKNTLFFLNRAVYEETWRNMTQPDKPWMTIRSMRFAWWVTKATETYSE